MDEMYNKAAELAEECGFSHWGEMDASTLTVHEEVRDMCASGKCQMYGKNWRCPPYCGTLPELQEKMHAFKGGIILQSTGELEDDFDVEVMMETEQLHKKHFTKLVRELGKSDRAILPLSAGTCTLCPSCTCPDEPCRHPEIAMSSMEACGLNVSEVCTLNKIPYYYGKLTITYTSCILF